MSLTLNELELNIIQQIYRAHMKCCIFKYSLDLEKKLLSFDLVIPKIRIDATYNLKGNILLLPLVGNGNVAMSMKDVKSSVYTKISIKKQPEVSLC